MSFAPDMLAAFAEAAAQGSFSAAARKLGRSQSTISESIATLEIALGVALFDRSTRRPQLTEAGRVLLGNARDVLAAQDRLRRSAEELAAGLESRLTLAVSDTWQSASYEAMLRELDRRYPDLEFECLIAEGADVLVLLEEGRAHLGLMAAQAEYPPGVGAAAARDAGELGLYVARRHPLAQRPSVTRNDLLRYRELRLHTFADEPTPATSARCWSAPSFLLLLEMAELGYGWAPLPRWLPARYAPRRLKELAVPGWPRRVEIDLVWSTQRSLGAAALWARQALTLS